MQTPVVTNVYQPPLLLCSIGRSSLSLNSYADVDGTLIRSIGDDSNQLHKDAFKQAFVDVFQLDTHIDKLKHHGGTDPLILMKVLMVCHDISKDTCMDRLDDMKAAMTAYYEANKSRC